MTSSTGTFTFLFTDIEGSTRLWEADAAAMQVALQRHDATMRKAIEGHGGEVFKTIGDAFCAAFNNANDALAAVSEAQIALQMEGGQIRVRMALHTGQAEIRDNDYFGPPLNRVARLLSTAHGEQVLVSQATYDQLGKDFELSFLGSHRLKDIAEPERIWQLSIPGCRIGFPPLRSAGRGANNLPGQVGPIIGREAEIAEVMRLVRDGRLVTISGSGGSGKTRLAVEVGTHLLGDFADGVWMVELAQLNEPDLLMNSIASAMELRERPATSISDALTTTLRDSNCLLILDNCEHLLEAVIKAAEFLIRSTTVTILATSREALGIAGELAYRLPSLRVPSDNSSVAEIERSPACQLFIDRAKGVQSNFTLTSANAQAVVQLCRKLDGLPLALELAAARVKVLSPEQLNQRLDDRFRLLTGGSRAAMPRQQTLRALVDWSYDLLNEAERVLLRRLSIFTGSWTLDAAEAISHEDVVDTLSALVDKSLVGFDDRYSMLETVRQYALEKLDESGETESLRDRHRDYFLAVAERAASELRGPRQAAFLSELEEEHGNMRSALEWCASHASGAEKGLRLASALRLFWDNRGYYSEGRAALARALSHGAARTVERAAALCNAAILAWNQGDYDASRTLQEESLAIRHEIDDVEGMAESMLCLGSQAYREGNPGSAQTYLYAALGMSDGYPVLRCQVLLWLGVEALQRRSLDEARQCLEESLLLARLTGWGRAIAMALYDLADVALLSNYLTEARVHLDEALEFGAELGTFTVFVVESYAELACAEGQIERAARLLGAAEAFRERKALALPPDNRRRLIEVIDSLRETMGDRFQLHFSAGRQTDWEEILFEAQRERALI